MASVDKNLNDETTQGGIDWDSTFREETIEGMVKNRVLLWPGLNALSKFGVSEVVPSSHVKIELPKFRAGGGYSETKWVRSGMHEDMTLAFLREIFSWKEASRKNIYIQGRALTSNMWKEMTDNEMYDFFYSSRNYREDKSSQDDVILKVLPKRLKDKIPRGVAQRWAILTFTPESLAEEIGHRAVWYPAEFLYRFGGADEDRGVYTLKPILSAVNSFEIGTNHAPGLLRMAKIRLEESFNKIHSGAIYRTMQDSLKRMSQSVAAYTVEI